MDDEDIEITVVPPNKPPTTYATVIPAGCRCDWKREGAGVDGATLLPEGAVATWFVLTRRDPQCGYHGDESTACTCSSGH